MPEDEVADEFVADVELELDEELEVAELADCAVVEVDEPGIVAALTAPRSPTPATAPIAAPVVRRFSRRIAESRVWILAAT